MKQTPHHRDIEPLRTEGRGPFLCASVVNAVDFFHFLSLGWQGASPILMLDGYAPPALVSVGLAACPLASAELE